LKALTSELDSTKQRLEQDLQERMQLAEKLAEAERANTESTARAEAAAALIAVHENSIRSQESQIQERRSQVERLEASLQSEIALRQKEKAEAEALATRLDGLSSQLAQKIADQEAWHRRESELEQCLRRQKEDLANSVKASTKRQMELRCLWSTLEDMKVIQSALCAQVRDLTHQRDTAFRQIQEMGGQCAPMPQIRDFRVDAGA
jgi:chromosome segregation ATPase